MAVKLTPKLTPTVSDKSMTMGFFDALKAIQAGKTVTRVVWGNKDQCYMKDSFLTIFTKGKEHSWIINDGDMEGTDWIVVAESN